MLCNTLLNSALVYSAISLLLLYSTILYYLYYTILYYTMKHSICIGDRPVQWRKYGTGFQ